MAAKKKPEERIELSAKAWELRKAGVPYAKIGRQLNISSRTAYKYIQTQIEEYQSEQRENVRSMVTLELSRLDDMMLGIWSNARQGDLKAIDATLKIMERRAKLLGLDVSSTAKQVSVSVTPEQIMSMSDDELSAIIGQLER